MITKEELRTKRLTVGELKAILKTCNVPDDALITCQSDEEGNRETVCDNIYIDRIGRVDTSIKDFTYTAGEDVVGFDPEDKGKIFVTFHPMY